jgi:hypothetical protein
LQYHWVVSDPPNAQGISRSAASAAGTDAVLIPFAAGHVSRAMLSRYSHVRMEAKRRALDEIAARQIAADEKRKTEATQQMATMVSRSAVLQ